jgi:uncharacterized protein YecE (DUF72 family)
VYRDWRGIVYPQDLRQKDWFRCYATMFDTVELNTTFYRLPTAVAVERWAADAPDDFVFAFKLGKFATHRKKLREPEWWMPNHLDRAERLGAKLGPTLIQLPPRWRRNATRLDEFLSMAPTSMRWAVEVRDPSWLHDETYEVLRRHHTALCVHDLLEDHPFMLTTDWTYVRFHGPRAVAEPYRGAYGKRRLTPWAERLGDVLDAGNDVYCYFNNDYDGHAVTDAKWLRGALDRA